MIKCLSIASVLLFILIGGSPASSTPGAERNFTTGSPLSTGNESEGLTAGNRNFTSGNTFISRNAEAHLPEGNSRIDDIRVYEDRIFNENIRTVLLHRKGYELSYPIIKINSGDELLLRFDDLEGDVKNYTYTVIHCNADWTPSRLSPSDYIEGFYENQIRNYRFSFNTFIPYTHYSLTLPNEDIRFRLSGNYILKVYEDFDRSKVAFTRRFFVNESRVHINAIARQPIIPEYRRSGHQIDFTVSHRDYNIRDPYSEVNVIITQNNRWDNAVKELKPDFIKNYELVYEDGEKNYFPGGNEFRTFDIQSLRFHTEFVRDIVFRHDGYHVKLFPGKPRDRRHEYHHDEINGRFLVRTRDEPNDNTDSEYVMVYFSLPWDAPLDNGDVYVAGDLASWNFYPWNRMEYNYETKSYELSMLLKQGYYNYQYLFLPEGEQEADGSMFEGNFFETENDYIIYVYHRLPGSRYDRLIGVQVTNSMRR